MHVPNPLGGIPLVLRDYDVSNPHRGELLLDYTKDDLYYIDKNTGLRVNVAEDIYKRIIEARLENPKINITKASAEVEGDEEIAPDIENRPMNNFYMNIQKRTERSEENPEA